ncbi:hypothetical protein C2E23DRAFT_817320, partial [Lenzites betulinus]
MLAAYRPPGQGHARPPAWCGKWWFYSCVPDSKKTHDLKYPLCGLGMVVLEG